MIGIDNVLFAVRDLDEAVDFYEACGFVLKFKVPQAQMALFAIGSEEPGLLIRVGALAGAGQLWVEVADADAVAAELGAKGIVSGRIETMTGITIDVTDPSGNVVGFADYSKQPDMGRRRT